jgi:hypothetical protein
MSRALSIVFAMKGLSVRRCGNAAFEFDFGVWVWPLAQQLVIMLFWNNNRTHWKGDYDEAV